MVKILFIIFCLGATEIGPSPSDIAKQARSIGVADNIALVVVNRVNYRKPASVSFDIVEVLKGDIKSRHFVCEFGENIAFSNLTATRKSERTMLYFRANHDEREEICSRPAFIPVGISYFGDIVEYADKHNLWSSFMPKRPYEYLMKIHEAEKKRFGYDDEE
jgi:hypothetical protein